MMEEVWVEYMDEEFSIHKAPWPSYEAKLISNKEVSVVIQVNGKVRSQITLDTEKAHDQVAVEKLAKEDKKVESWLTGKDIKKVVFVPGKIINFVVYLSSIFLSIITQQFL